MITKLLRRVKRLMGHSRSGRNGIDYEGTWDSFAMSWKNAHPGLTHIGDEWIGVEAGAATSLAEYELLIEKRFIEPYIKMDHTVLEIGVGGGRTASLLKKHCKYLICADISYEMLKATRRRLGNEDVSFVKLDGITLNSIDYGVVDVCFSYDTMVHLEPRDIFNYLMRIPPLMRGERLCIFHHANILSELGWKRFLKEWDKNLLGRRSGGAFSVMTNDIMERFLIYLNYDILIKDTSSVPRDCVWICRAPQGVVAPPGKTIQQGQYQL